jgi:hypothetical protein
MKVFFFRLPMILMFVITSILIILKLNDVIFWSWDDVFLPLQLFVILGVFFALVYVFIDIKEKKSKKINNKQEFY